MNKQEIFNKVKKRLLDGTGRAMSSNGITCAYENKDGLRCAVGVLFPDEMPKEIKESRLTLLGLIENEETSKHVPQFIKDNSKLVEELRIVHDCGICWDGNTFNERGIGHIKRVAKVYGLEYDDGQ